MTTGRTFVRSGTTVAVTDGVPVPAVADGDAIGVAVATGFGAVLLTHGIENANDLSDSPRKNAPITKTITPTIVNKIFLVMFFTSSLTQV